MPELPEKPEGRKFYGPLEPATLTDGWCYGYITEAPCELHPEGCRSGDGYVVAPDGSYAGLIWSSDCAWECRVIETANERPPTDVDKPGSQSRRVGIFEVRFPRPVRTLDDLIWNFRWILPQLQSTNMIWRDKFVSM